jgi:hypothetical protein
VASVTHRRPRNKCEQIQIDRPKLTHPTKVKNHEEHCGAGAVALAGSAGGFLKTGQSMSFPNGTSQKDMLITLCQAMGMSDVKTFGNPKYRTAPIPGLIA